MARQTTENNKRIAKNTMMLYFRMIVVTVLSLITIKYTLNILGVDNYGIYNVVGSVVTFLNFVTVTISSATQRFLAFELGREDDRAYNNTFNMLLLVFAGACALLLVLFEAFAYPIIHLWLNLPADRLDAAAIVYQLSVGTFLIHVMAIPFISSIMANERMGVYAYITIADTVAKLLLLGILIYSPYDKLISYGVGTLLITLAVNLIYVAYNQLKVAATRIYYYWERNLFRQLMSYTGWSFFGSVSGIMCNQGLSIVMNLYFGVQVNAAKGIADKIKGILQSFVSNFYMAVSPQITKTYAAGDTDYTIKLAFSSTRLAYYLLFALCLPVILLADDVLHFWLEEGCTDDMVMFTRLSLMFILVNVFEAPITFMVRSTGDIKDYQVYIGIFTLLIVPVSYILYMFGLPAYTAFVCEIVIYAFVQWIRVYIAKRFYAITFKGYFIDVLAKPIVITTVTVLASILLSVLLDLNMIIVSIVVMPCLLAMIMIYGLNETERKMVAGYIKSKIAKRH